MCGGSRAQFYRNILGAWYQDKNGQAQTLLSEAKNKLKGGQQQLASTILAGEGGPEGLCQRWEELGPKLTASSLWDAILPSSNGQTREQEETQPTGPGNVKDEKTLRENMIPIFGDGL